MLQQRLNEKGCQLPIIFVSGYADVAMAAKAFKAGAFDFLQKPFNLSDLLDRIHLALEKDANQPEVARDANEARMKLESLTRREREVLDCLIKGCTSKEIAKQLDISHRTVDVHRQHILTKFNTNSVPALLAMLLETS
jgi:FixJ family two-component response regulator